ncbi:MAG: putative DNA-binding transcriptional regulator YafY [Planctomycetota bacterium]|jgi:predicted DNA-binding transcriptional regulator YafY
MNLSLETVLQCLDILPIVRENQGISLADLAARTGLDAKKISDQLIPTLMLCGSPPYMPHDYVNMWLDGDHVYVEFADHFKRPVTLLPIEITALHLSLTAAARPGEHDEEVRRRLSDLRRKIERALPEAQRIFLEESERVSLSDHPDRGSPHLDSIRNAMNRSRKIEIEYLSFGDKSLKRRIVHPHGILVKDGVSYIPCFDENRGHICSFRLDRINEVTLLQDHFVPQPGFSVEEHARDGLTRPGEDDELEVLLEARGATARFLSESLDQRQWHWQKNDVLAIKLPTSRPRSVVHWAIKNGPDVTIVGPPEVRTLAMEVLQEIRSEYVS